MKLSLHRLARSGMSLAGMAACAWMAATGWAAAQAPAATDASLPALKAVSWEDIHARWSSQPLATARAAAEAGEVTAEHYLGRYFADGMGGTTNWDEALKWYHRAADRGFASSQNDLGQAYLSGRGVTQDREEAARWFRLAAAQGFATAQRNLAGTLQKQRGRPAKDEEVRGLLEQAARGGDVEAMVRLGRLLTQWGASYYEPANALYWFKKAVRAGNTTVYSNIGWLYAEGWAEWVGAGGNSGQKDYEIALKWFQQGQALGDTYCDLSLGWLYLEGHGVPQSLPEAFKLIQQAADKGNPAALRNLGRLYAHDEVPLAPPGPPDLIKAAGYYRQAMDAGDADGTLRLARLLVPRTVSLSGVDTEKVVRRAVEDGRGESFVLLARLIEEGRARALNEQEEPLRLYYRAAAESRGEALAILSQRYLKGNDVPQDLLVVAHYELILERLPWGEFTRAQDARLPEWTARYLTAVRSRNIAAAMEIGDGYRDGRDTYQSDFEAYVWYAYAARNGDPTAVAAKEKAGAKLKSMDLSRAEERIRNMKNAAVQKVP